MGLTAEGNRLKNNLLNFKIDLDALRAIIDKVPAMVVKRVKETGEGSKNRFTAYSDGIIPRGQYRGMTWKQVRSGKGLQTGNKDFWFDGIMWGSYQVTDENVKDLVISYTLTTTDGKTRGGTDYLADIHSDKEGQNILDITEQEEEKIMDDVFNVVLKSYDTTIR